MHFISITAIPHLATLQRKHTAFTTFALVLSYLIKNIPQGPTLIQSMDAEFRIFGNYEP